MTITVNEELMHSHANKSDCDSEKQQKEKKSLPMPPSQKRKEREKAAESDHSCDMDHLEHLTQQVLQERLSPELQHHHHHSVHSSEMSS